MIIGMGQAAEGEICYLGCPNSVCEDFSTGKQRVEPNPSCAQGNGGAQPSVPSQPTPSQPGQTQPQIQVAPGQQATIGLGTEVAPSCSLPPPWSQVTGKLTYAQWAYCNRGLVVIGAAGLVLIIALAGRRRR
jgi:hypothetical protein